MACLSLVGIYWICKANKSLFSLCSDKNFNCHNIHICFSYSPCKHLWNRDVGNPETLHIIKAIYTARLVGSYEWKTWEAFGCIGSITRVQIPARTFMALSFMVPWACHWVTRASAISLFKSVWMVPILTYLPTWYVWLKHVMCNCPSNFYILPLAKLLWWWWEG